MFNIPMRSGGAYNSSSISNLNGLRVTPAFNTQNVSTINGMFSPMNPYGTMGAMGMTNPMGAMGMGTMGMGGNMMQAATMAVVANELMNDHNTQNQQPASYNNNMNTGAGPQNNFGAGPQNNFGAGPQNNFGSQPQNNFGSQPQNNFGSQPQNNFGSQPQNNFGSQPQNNFGSQPQNNFGSQPQNNFGAGQPQQANVNPAPAMNQQPQVAPAPVAKPIPQLQNPTMKGQKVSLDGVTAASKIKACFGWNTNNGACDVDVSAFLLGANGKVIGDDWFVFYGQPESPDKSTVFANDDGADREIVTIDFAKLNTSVTKIVFVLTINEALQKNLNFSMLSDAYVRILDADTNNEYRSFKMDEYYSNVTSMMIGEVYQHNGAWKFNAIGNGVAKDLAGLCELYGVQVV